MADPAQDRAAGWPAPAGGGVAAGARTARSRTPPGRRGRGRTARPPRPCASSSRSRPLTQMMASARPPPAARTPASSGGAGRQAPEPALEHPPGHVVVADQHPAAVAAEHQLRPGGVVAVEVEDVVAPEGRRDGARTRARAPGRSAGSRCRARCRRPRWRCPPAAGQRPAGRQPGARQARGAGSGNARHRRPGPGPAGRCCRRRRSSDVSAAAGRGSAVGQRLDRLLERAVVADHRQAEALASRR